MTIIKYTAGVISRVRLQFLRQVGRSALVPMCFLRRRKRFFVPPPTWLKQEREFSFGKINHKLKKRRNSISSPCLLYKASPMRPRNRLTANMTASCYALSSRVPYSSGWKCYICFGFVRSSIARHMHDLHNRFSFEDGARTNRPTTRLEKSRIAHRR